jgi:ubiquinone/menaquinone biosynthesis C-methylase UbiE
MSIDPGAFKEAQKAMWTAGDYGQVAQRIASVGNYVAERAGAGPEIELLDVATGTGNVSIPAAQAGATVTALDLTPKLLAEQSERAAAAGVEVKLVEGDAEALPFADDSFDRVTSCFGVMFAPRQRVAASELVRVVRPDGEIVVAAWTPDGLIGQVLRLNASYMPTPPEDFVPPVMWGDDKHVRDLLETLGARVSTERRTVTFQAESVEAYIARDEQILGPLLLARAVLEQQGRYDDLRRDVLAVHEQFNDADDGTFRAQAEYLLTVARPAAAPSDG